MKLLALLMLTTLTAHAENKPVAVAICTTYGTGQFFGGAKYEFFGFSEADATVKFSGIGEDGRAIEPVEVPSHLRMDTWVTYAAGFEVDGHKLQLKFSNYQSPSVGSMKVDGGEGKPIACMLPGYNQ